MPRVRLDLAYDGTDFAGWAAQPGLRTCQGVLEDALHTVTRRAVRVTVAGRTDAGVHASGQVAHVDLDGPPDPRLAHRLTSLVREGDLVVRSAALAPAGFDARFSAVHRRYEYRIQTRVADPLVRRTSAFVPRALDDAAMQRAADVLVGLHDFAAFCKPREGATTIRSLQAFSWAREGDLLVASVQADAFCHSMVRSLVGACVAVGEGRLGLAQAAALLDARGRSSAFRMMPAAGLTLVEVGYPPDDELAAQAERARARRSAADVERPAG
ncbi:tRNA pseudouridine(38-40) synthase TruA [Agrococcus sp. SGAir0287]|uniref:tRNA pseudouridine(38-40) synthase TruA n=1 Tax=Agrococcus sp. SGAir0287 TaxID=2070347 RepID=UPI0010CCCA50|nr:tRNA pseudouridine(38-40) synthase TruA [Agrococcus sp. SGAir0287]QCR20047.1 tRNA pseudouridine(38-40) synthase TruA [Agrococcus sp. SGAir0287]